MSDPVGNDSMKHKKTAPLPGERLQKVLAGAGVASRRAAEGMRHQGRGLVNDLVVREMGFRVQGSDTIRVDGMLIGPRPENVYLMLNKPRGYVTTLKDPEGRPIVADLIPESVGRVFPVGRLDYDSEGLLLLTNDGAWAHRLQHPGFLLEKTYLVKVKGKFPRGDPSSERGCSSMMDHSAPCASGGKGQRKAAGSTSRSGKEETVLSGERSLIWVCRSPASFAPL